MLTIKVKTKNNSYLELNNQPNHFQRSSIPPASMKKLMIFLHNFSLFFSSLYQLSLLFSFKFLIGILLTAMVYCVPMQAFANPAVSDSISQLELTPTEQTWLDSHSVVTYGSGADRYPFEYVDESGNHSGVSLDYLNKVAELTGIEFIPVYLTWQEIIDKTKTGDIDLMLTLAKIEEREQFFHFSQPHTDTTFYYFAKKGFSAPDDISGVTADDLSGVKIALIKGHTINQTVREQFPTATFSEAETWQEGLKLVQADKADICVNSHLNTNRYFKARGIDNIVPYLPSELTYMTEYHMATNINNAILIGIINKSLEHITQEEKANIYSKWLSDTFNNDEVNEEDKIVYTESEQQWLNEHKIIHYSGSPDWQPLGYSNTKGEYEGIVKDFLMVIDTAVKGSHFDYVTTKTVEDTFTKMENDDIQLIPAPLVQNQLDDYLLTDAIMSMPVNIAMTDKQKYYIEDITELEGKKIAIHKRLLTFTKLDKKYPTLDFIPTESLQEGIEGVSSGKYDANLASGSSTTYMLAKQGVHNVSIVGSTGIRIDIKMAVHKRNAPLVGIFNKSNAKISLARSKNILTKWGRENSVIKKEADYMLLGQVIFGGVVLLLAIWLWNRSLASEIKLRKKEMALRKEEMEMRKHSEEKLKSANQRLELATHTVGLVVWEILFPRNITKEALTIDSPQLDEILVYDDESLFEQRNKKIRARNNSDIDGDFYVETCDAEGRSLTEGVFTLKQWLIKVVDKGNVLHHINDIRVSKKRRELEVELYDSTRVYDDISEARKIVFASISYDDSQEREKIVGTKWDITEIKKNEQALLLSNKRIESARQDAEIANQTKSDFLANMSHEIRTPLNVIIGYTELLNEKAIDSSMKKVLTTINTAGKDLLLLVNDILDISKIEAGKLDIVIKPCNLSSLMDATSNIFKLAITEKELHFQLIYDPKIPSSLFLDEVRIRQILVNLIGNAIKFTQQGSITLNAKLLVHNIHESTVDIVFEVSDTGMGIAEKNLDAIFNKFEQVDSKSTREFDGAGLGLAICNRLADMMDGELSVSSTLGSGSTFRLTLKNLSIATLASADTDRQELLNINSIDFEPATIMIVDDIKHNRDLIVDVFDTTNINVLTAKDGKDAIEKIKTKPVDLIFMDIYMPEMDGYQATQTIKENHDIPIIVLTASLMQEYDLEDRQIFDGFLNKPALKSELYQEIMKYLPFTQNEAEISTFINNNNSGSVEQMNIEAEYLPVIIEALVNLQPKCQALLEANDINGTKDFVKELSTLMSDHPINSVRQYIEVFEDNLNNFSIKGFRQSLTDFDVVLQRLQKRLENDM